MKFRDAAAVAATLALPPLAAATAWQARLPPADAAWLSALAGSFAGVLIWLLARRHARQRAEASEAFMQRLIDTLPYPFYLRDAHSRFISVNQALIDQQLPGMRREDVLGRTLAELTPHSPRSYLSRTEDQQVMAGEALHKEELGVRNHSGESYRQIVIKNRCLDAYGRPVLVGLNVDITPLHKAESGLSEALEREREARHHTLEFVQRLIDIIPDPVYVKKAGGRYQMVNQAFLDYHGQSREKVLAGANSLAYKREEVRRLSLAEDDAVLAGEEVRKEEHTTRQLTGEEVYRIVFKHRSTFIDGDPVVVGIDHHITPWRVAERELQRLAREDALTGIANRRHFSQVAADAIERALRYAEPLSLILLDIDHFKRINDSHGHAVGDAVLIETVNRCKSCLRSSDLLARWGGEEFIVLLPHTPLEEACRAAERLRAALADTPIASSAGPLHLTLSGGACQWHDGEALDTFVRQADNALYLAKASGRNRVCTPCADSVVPLAS